MDQAMLLKRIGTLPLEPNPALVDSSMATDRRPQSKRQVYRLLGARRNSSSAQRGQ
jgi:hypothetical protein